MKLKVVILSIVAAVFSLTAIAETDQATTTQSTTTQTTTTPSTTTPSTATTSTNATSQTTSDKSAKKDAEILGILLVLNNNEVDAGKLAEGKATNPDVKQFAQTMETDHSKNIDDTKTLASKIGVDPATTDKSKSFEKKGKAELDKLNATADNKFDIVYMTAMIKGHKEVLAFINSGLAKTKNPDVKQHLEATKDAVKKHLQTALDVRKKLK